MIIKEERVDLFNLRNSYPAFAKCETVGQALGVFDREYVDFAYILKDGSRTIDDKKVHDCYGNKTSVPGVIDVEIKDNCGHYDLFEVPVEVQLYGGYDEEEEQYSYVEHEIKRDYVYDNELEYLIEMRNLAEKRDNPDTDYIDELNRSIAELLNNK